MGFRYLVLVCIVVALGCSPDGLSDRTRPQKNGRPVNSEPKEIVYTTLENGEPSHVSVQHCLISFKGRLDPKPVLRNEVEAKKLADELFEKAKAGEDFDAIVKAYTDDNHPGIYHIANFNQETDQSSPNQSEWIRARDGLVPAFGQIGFSLKVGDIGMAEYNPESSPFGWHIIKRIK